MHFYSAILFGSLTLTACAASLANNALYYNISTVHGVVNYGEQLGRHSARSMVECARLCSKTTACRSAMYSVHQKMCSTNRWHMDPSSMVTCVDDNVGIGCPADIWRKYAAKQLKTTMKQPCRHDYDCVDPMSECRRGVCSCVPGLSYSPSAHSCVTECTQYGTTFQLEHDKRLSETNDEVHATTRDGCKELCLSATAFVCRTAEFNEDNIGVNCALSSITAFTRPDLYQDYIGTELYTRDCV